MRHGRLTRRPDAWQVPREQFHGLAGRLRGHGAQRVAAKSPEETPMSPPRARETEVSREAMPRDLVLSRESRMGGRYLMSCS